MRTRSVLLTLVAAAVGGTLLGTVVLPDRTPRSVGEPGSTVSASSTPAASPTSASASPSVSPAATASPTGIGAGPLTAEQLLTTADLRAVGLDLTRRQVDGDQDVIRCTDDRPSYRRLSELTGTKESLAIGWEGGSHGSVGVDEEVTALQSNAAAEAVAGRILERLRTCLKQPPGRTVLDFENGEDIDDVTTARWFGWVDGSFNTKGSAPDGAGILGGIAVLRRGSHVGILSIGFCEGAGESRPCVVGAGDPSGQLADLSAKAARRLG